MFLASVLLPSPELSESRSGFAEDVRGDGGAGSAASKDEMIWRELLFLGEAPEGGLECWAVTVAILFEAVRLMRHWTAWAARQCVPHAPSPSQVKVP